MKTLTLATFVALAAAAPSFANTQLARALGIEPGTLSTAELATLKGLREGGASTDRDTADTLAALFSRGVVSTQSVGAAGNVQLGASLGLVPTAYTTAELATIKGITEERATADASHAAFLAAQGSNGFASTQSVDTAGRHAQLASLLKVDPSNYSLAELAVIKGRSELAQDD
jgi:hypothetical protein